MNTGIFLSYKGLGTNMLHLCYCHEIAKVFGPVEIVTLSHNFKDVVDDDPLIKKVTYLDKYYKRLVDIYNLAKVFKQHKFNNFFIFYPSLRFFIAAKLAGIENIFSYPFFKKKNLHLVNEAKKFVEKNLNIENCSTETSLFIGNSNKKIASTYLNKTRKNIIIGAGSSGPTTKWGSSNYIKLINELQKRKECYFFILGGAEEKKIVNEIVNQVGEKNAISLSDKNIKEIVSIISGVDMYIGNDSFGQHIASQCGKPSIILLLDTPSAYSEYSKNQHQITPEGASIKNISHDSSFDPNSIGVETVLNKALSYL